MFQKPEPSSSSGRLKILPFSAVGLLLALGFCGLDAHLYPDSEFGGSFLAVMGLILGVACAASVLAAALNLIGQAIINFFRR